MKPEHVLGTYNGLWGAASTARSIQTILSTPSPHTTMHLGTPTPNPTSRSSLTFHETKPHTTKSKILDKPRIANWRTALDSTLKMRVRRKPFAPEGPQQFSKPGMRAGIKVLLRDRTRNVCLYCCFDAWTIPSACFSPNLAATDGPHTHLGVCPCLVPHIPRDVSENSDPHLTSLPQQNGS